jgi:nucleotide-binding universal stress UspA family protein
MFKVLMAADGSEHDAKTAAFLSKLLRGNREAQVVLLHAPEFQLAATAMMGPGYMPYIPPREELERWEAEMQQRAQEVVSQAEDLLRRAELSFTTKVVWGTPADVIIQVAKDEQCDLIVVGSRGAGQITGVLLGSVSDKVAHRAEIPVLIVH